MSGKVWGVPLREDRSFFVQLHIRKEAVSETLAVLQRGCRKVADFGIGVPSAPKDYWVEVVQFCADSGEFLQQLARLGIPREAIRECREVVSGSGHLMARQRNLFG